MTSLFDGPVEDPSPDQPQAKPKDQPSPLERTCELVWVPQRTHVVDTPQAA